MADDTGYGQGARAAQRIVKRVSPVGFAVRAILTILSAISNVRGLLQLNRAAVDYLDIGQ